MNPRQCLQEPRKPGSDTPGTGCRPSGSCTCPQLTCSKYDNCDACRAKHLTTLPHCERMIGR